VDIFIHPFELPGTKYQRDEFRGGLPGSYGVICKDTEYPERAIAYADYLLDGRTQAMYVCGAREGVDWYMMPDGMPTKTAEGERVWHARDTDTLFAKTGASSFTGFRDNITVAYSGRVDGVWSEGALFKKECLSITNKYYADFYKYSLANPLSFPADSEELKLWTVIKDYAGNELVRIAAGKPEDVKPAYDAFLNKIKELGIDKVNAYVTNKFNSVEAEIAKYSN